MTQGNIASFENLPSSIKKVEELDERLKILITQHLPSLETVFKRCFPQLEEQETAVVRNPFLSALNVSDILNEF